ncbi:MAG TPA: hypothetical protein VK403_05440, partial [Allosphingosinicella sp.]|nr:hypothetical protein [Allosphingosinicella sp.]
MPLRTALLASFICLPACGNGAEASAQTAVAASSPQAWTIGPIIRGRNHSVGMPLHPTARRGGGWYFDIP